MRKAEYTARCRDCEGPCSDGAERCRSCREKYRWRDPNDPRRVPPYGLQPGDALWPTCECGCGEPVPARRAGCSKRRHVKGEPCKFVAGHSSRVRWKLPVDGLLRCPKCGEAKLTAEFNRDSRRPSGYCPWCRKCEAAKAAEWYRRNRERVAKAGVEYKAANPDVGRAASARWIVNNRDLYLARARIAASAYRARKRNLFVEDVDAFVVYERDQGLCGICGGPVDRHDFHVDHVVPLSRGGEHSYANVQLAHPFCNCRKHNKMIPKEAAHG